jgi:putative hemolysin
MTPRNEVIWIDLDEPAEERRRVLRECGRSQFPVARGTLDAVQGVLRVKDWLRVEERPPGDDASLLQPALFVPETADALALLKHFQKSRQHIAVVLDEHGGTAGIVTLHDILEAIVGDLPPADEDSEPLLVTRSDGSWHGRLAPVRTDFRTRFACRIFRGGGRSLPRVGGLVMSALRRIPREGDAFETSGVRLEVVDMDGRRVDKVLVTRVTSPSSA